MRIYLSLLLTFGLLSSCSKTNTTKTFCTEEILIEFEMEEYTDQELDCNNFLTLYHYNSKEYYLLGNHCVDMISNPIDCEGNKLCESKIRTKCNNFFKNAVEIGIIGIKQQ